MSRPAPTLDDPEATADAGETGESINLTGSGFYEFGDYPKVELRGDAINGISNYSISNVTATSLTVTFDVAANASLGSRDIVLTNPDGQIAAVQAGVEIQ